MTTIEGGHSASDNTLEEIYLTADKNMWHLTVASSLLVLLLGLYFDNLYLALGGVVFNSLSFYFTTKLVSSHVVKHYLIGIITLLWTVLFVLITNQMAEAHFVALAYLVLLSTYQAQRPVVVMTVLYVFFALFSFAPLVTESAAIKSLSLHLVREQDIHIEQLIISLLLVVATAVGSLINATTLRRQSVSKLAAEAVKEDQLKITERNRELANKMANGDFEIEKDNHVSDELTESLEQMRNNLKAADEKEKQDRFESVGMAEVSDILRKYNDNLENLTNQVLSYLVKYLDVNQGGLYLIDEIEHEKKLVQVACFAFEKKKHETKVLDIGQGQLGQVVLEKEPMYMTDLPKDYINITSGLGGANPSCLLIVPLIVNEEVFGAMELASFKKLEEFEIAFTNKVAVSIASAVNAAKTSENTQKLLTEAQEQAEQLRTQEEEMRQNMEELTATQEEIERKTIEMEGRMKAITMSGVASIEFDLQGTILSANEAFLNLMGYEESEVVGRHQRMFVKPDYAATEEYKTQWQRMAKGEKIEGEFEMLNKKGESIFIKGAYSAILDIHHNPVKIIKLATDITETKNLYIAAQQNAEQIAVQEKEIRQSLSELKSAQKESDIRMTEMKFYLDALNTSMITLEMNLEGGILDSNDAMLTLLGYNKDKLLKELKHVDLMHEEDALSAEYTELWEKLRQGEKGKSTQRRKNSQGAILWFRSYYFPKLNLQGEVESIIELSSDYTTEKVQEEKIMQNEKILHERVKSIEDKAYNRIVKLKKDLKQKLAEKDELIATLEKK